MGIEEKTDSLFTKVEKYVTQKIGTFVAFLFLIFTLGAIAAIQVSMRWPEQAYLVVILPLLAGLVSYYNRVVASFFFTIFIILLLLF